MDSKYHAINNRPQPPPPLPPPPPPLTSNPPFATPYFSQRPMGGSFARMVPPMMRPVNYNYRPRPPQPPPSQHTLYLPSGIAYFSEGSVGGGSIRMVPPMMGASVALQRELEKGLIQRAMEQDRQRPAFQERVNLQLNSVAIKDLPQPHIMDHVELKPANREDYMQKRVHLRLKSFRIEDFPQPSFMDPHEIKPINKQDDMQEQVNMRLNYVADLPQPLIMDPTKIKLADNKQDDMQVAIEDVLQSHIMDDPAESKQTNNQDEVISLAKPDPGVNDAKRKAVEHAVNDSQISLLKKPKKELGCTLCQITTTDESGLNAHLRGNKHKAKEAALGAKKIGKSSIT